MLAELLLASALLSGSPSAAPTTSQLLQVEHNIIHHTNLQRQRHGLPPLAIDPSLVSSARRQASWMARVNSLQHTSAPVAENIAMGQTSSVQAVRDWMNSPGHRANILNGSYRRVGAAAYVSPRGATYWCLQLLH